MILITFKKLDNLKTRTIFLCIPSLIEKYEYALDSSLVKLDKSSERRKYFTWNFLWSKMPNKSKCIGWLALDLNHIWLNLENVKDDEDHPNTSNNDDILSKFIYTSIPVSDQHFVSCLSVF